VVRRAGQLPHRPRLRHRRHRRRSVVGRRRRAGARDRQGHRALPRRVLDRLPPVGRPSPAQPDPRARLPHRERNEDRQVGRAGRRSDRPGRLLRRGRRALVAAPRPGAHRDHGLHRRTARRGLPPRARQHAGQPGVACADPGAPRRVLAHPGPHRRRGRGPASAGGRPAHRGRRRGGSLRRPRRLRGDRRARGGGEPLPRERGAVAAGSASRGGRRGRRPTVRGRRRRGAERVPRRRHRAPAVPAGRGRPVDRPARTGRPADPTAFPRIGAERRP